MNNFTVKILGDIRPNTYIYLDGNRMRVLKKKGERFINYQTENPTVTMEIKSFSFLTMRLYFLVELFFFFISVFGIFDKKIRKPYMETEVKISFVATEQTVVQMRYMDARRSKSVVYCKSNCALTEEVNAYQINPVLKKRLTIVRLIKLFALLLTVGLVLVLIL